MTRCLCVALVLLVSSEARGGEKEVVNRLEGLGAYLEYAGSRTKLSVLLVSLSGRGARDTDLVDLRELHTLAILVLTENEVTDAGMRSVGNLRGLKELYLGGTGVTDAGLKELTQLGQLRLLDLKRTRVTVAGVAELQKALPDCEILR